MSRRFLQQEEMSLWHAVMHDVMPLKRSFSKTVPSKIQKKKCQSPEEKELPEMTNAPEEIVFKSSLETVLSLRPKHHELFVGVRNPGLDNTQWRKLARGKIAVDGRLDLHGYSVQEAFDRLISFMGRAKAGHWRCVEIITGLGSGEKGGMIRRELPLWLQRADIRPFILAVVHPHQGNQGSVRVLLKKQRD